MSRDNVANKLAQLTKQWSVKQPHKKAPRPKPATLHPGTLEAKVASSPYAAMLASPLRKCAITQRVFPNQLLLRFGIGLHPETMDQIVYATVERRPQGGKGSYMLLRKSLVDAIKKGEYRAVIRSQAKYRQDMPDYVQQKLCMYANDCFNKIQAKSLCIPLQPNTKDAKSWKCDKSIQCIIRLQNGSSFCELDHRIEAANEPIPCYNATQLWSKETVDALQNKYNAPAIGIIKSFESVDLAIALWRCRQYNS